MCIIPQATLLCSLYKELLKRVRRSNTTYSNTWSGLECFHAFLRSISETGVDLGIVNPINKEGRLKDTILVPLAQASSKFSANCPALPPKVLRATSKSSPLTPSIARASFKPSADLPKDWSFFAKSSVKRLAPSNSTDRFMTSFGAVLIKASQGAIWFFQRWYLL